jgi:UDP-glucose 4-epimerase
MKTYLITGIAGFIGSAIARRLIKDGYKVVGIDNFLTGLKENIPSEVEFIELDISKAEELKALDKFKFDAVLHLAAQTSGEISFDDPPKDLMINSLGTLNLLQYCKDRGDINRFLYASSVTVCGDSDVNPIPITQRTNPKSYYGITKLAAENYVTVFSKYLDTTVLRMYNVYGPGQNMENTKQGMVSIYLYYFMKDKPILVKGSGDRFRDFIYIDDVVSAWTKAIDNKETYGKKYNLGSGDKTTVEGLLKVIAEKWGNPDYPIEYAEGTPGDAFGSQADIEETKKDLDWKPEMGIEEGIEKTVEWVKNLSK